MLRLILIMAGQHHRFRLDGCCRAGDAARQVTVQEAADSRGGRGDALAGGQDGGSGLGARIAACPGRRAGEGVLNRDAVAGAGDECYGVCFGFAYSLAAGCGGTRRVGGRVVQEYVSELVCQRPDGLAAGEAGEDADAAGGP